MAEVPTLETERLVLRDWRDEDRDAFAKMNADERVMKHFPVTLTRQRSDELVDLICEHFRERGFGLWAVEIKAGPSFAGFVGLWTPTFEAHFTPCTEIGWRLMAECWGNGYAPEGARAALEFGFQSLDEIVSLTAVQNHPSRRVMEKIGMNHNEADDFDHPALPDGHELKRHVLYRLTRDQWASTV